MRVIEWIVNRVKGDAQVTETAIGGMPHAEDININGLDTDNATLKDLLSVDSDAWIVEMEQIREYLAGYGDRLPTQMITELDQVLTDLR